MMKLTITNNLDGTYTLTDANGKSRTACEISLGNNNGMGLAMDANAERALKIIDNPLYWLYGVNEPESAVNITEHYEFWQKVAGEWVKI